MVPQQPRRRRRRVLSRSGERRVVLARGVGGFGFTIAGQRPCVVSAVAPGGPAERAGLRPGDALLAVDGANVSRAPHASVARLVASAPGAIALTVAPREAPPTDTEDTEPDERARTRRRHPPPRRRPQMPHHPGCHIGMNSPAVNEILQNLSRAQLTPHHASRLECRTVVGYLGTIETPQAANMSAPSNVRTAVRKLRQERRPATPVLLSVLPNALLLRRPIGQVLAEYHRERIVYAGCGSDADRRYFGLVTSGEASDAEASHSCHVFAVDPRMAEHETHTARAREFQIACTRDPVAERCLEFPPSAEYVVGVVRGMYSLPPDDCTSPTLAQISKLAVKGDSPALGNFERGNRPVFRVPRDRRPCRHDDARLEGQEFVANSPQPSNHSEITTTSSNSDSGIGFHNDGRYITDRILVVDFAGQQQAPNRFKQEMPRRPVGMVGCSSFDADGSFLSNTTPVVDGFGGQGRALNLDDVILNANDMPIRRVSPRNEEDGYNYNNIYGNIPSTSRGYSAPSDPYVISNNERFNYEIAPPIGVDLDVVNMTDTFNSVEICEDRKQGDCQSNESVDNLTVISGGTSKASVDSVSVYSSRSHEEVRPALRKHLQASLDDMLVLGLRDKPQNRTTEKEEGTFVHPANVKFKVRKSIKPLNLLSRTKYILSGREREKNKKEARRRAVSASAEDVCGDKEKEALPAAASEPDLRDTQSDQNSPFRRWTTSAGTGSSCRHDPRSVYNKQLSEGTAMAGPSKKEWYGGVSRWSLGLEHLLADPVGIAAFAHFLAKEFAGENIRFWYSCENYTKSDDPEVRAKLAGEIWKRHLADGAPEPVNVDAAAKRATALKMEQSPPPEDVFHQAQKQIFSVMKFDSYPRFLRSPIHAECARADLCGQTPPFLKEAMLDEACPVPPALLQRSVSSDAANADTSSAKLKKSVSSASERRRSGGVSLMPWRRAGSRDRARDQLPPPAPAAAAATATAPESRVTDVVKATQAVPGGSTLCRVVLPDGATSVVEVDDSTSVGKLVDRLLARRNLRCNAYEVTLKEPKQGESRIIDSSSSSSTFGGREIVVDKRCLVRLEVGGRCVMVRCKPSRRLRHIVRPVIAKYLPSETIDKISVVKNGVIVDYDTIMEDLDGKKMSMVSNSNLTEILRLSDLEADSMNDVNIQLPDDDERTNALSRVRMSDSSPSLQSVPSGITVVVPVTVNPVPPSMGSTSSIVTPPTAFANSPISGKISISSATGSDASAGAGRISPSAITSPDSCTASGMSTPSRSSSSAPSERIFTPPSEFNSEVSPVNSNMSMIPPPCGFAAPPGPSMSVAVQTTSPTTVAVQTTMSPIKDIRSPPSPFKEQRPSTINSIFGQNSHLRLQLDHRAGPSGAKVRASLKQGSPLHQRSPTDMEGYSAGEAREDHQPAPYKAAIVSRPPPPLPPKPSRQLSLV